MMVGMQIELIAAMDAWHVGLLIAALIAGAAGYYLGKLSSIPIETEGTTVSLAANWMGDSKVCLTVEVLKTSPGEKCVALHSVIFAADPGTPPTEPPTGSGVDHQVHIHDSGEWPDGIYHIERTYDPISANPIYVVVWSEWAENVSYSPRKANFFVDAGSVPSCPPGGGAGPSPPSRSAAPRFYKFNIDPRLRPGHAGEELPKSERMPAPGNEVILSYVQSKSATDEPMWRAEKVDRDDLEWTLQLWEHDHRRTARLSVKGVSGAFANRVMVWTGDAWNYFGPNELTRFAPGDADDNLSRVNIEPA